MTNAEPPAFTSVAISKEHDTSTFDCGVSVMNEWLRRNAVRAQDAGAARTFVWVAPPSVEVVAYFSIAPTQVLRSEVSAKLAGGYSTIPAYLLARLAVTQRLQGQGLGEDLLHDALTRIVRASDSGGGRLIVVDAIDESAVSFYSRFDFHVINADARRMGIKISTVREKLGLGTARVESLPGSGLGAITVRRPDGSVAPVVLDPDEMRAVAKRLFALIDQQGAAGGGSIDLSAVLRDVLGRDPFKP